MLLTLSMKMSYKLNMCKTEFLLPAVLPASATVCTAHRYHLLALPTPSRQLHRQQLSTLCWFRLYTSLPCHCRLSLSTQGLQIPDGSCLHSDPCGSFSVLLPLGYFESERLLMLFLCLKPMNGFPCAQNKV